MANPYTRAMADFVAGLRFRAIPTEVRERIKLLILDALGCALYGAKLEWCRILHETLSQLDGGESCVV
jgi:aconitate decarboxylase